MTDTVAVCSSSIKESSSSGKRRARVGPDGPMWGLYCALALPADG